MKYFRPFSVLLALAVRRHRARGGRQRRVTLDMEYLPLRDMTFELGLPV